MVLRKANGEERDLTDYLQYPGSEADVYPPNVLAMGPAGHILLRQQVVGTAVSNVALLTPR